VDLTLDGQARCVATTTFANTTSPSVSARSKSRHTGTCVGLCPKLEMRADPIQRRAVGVPGAPLSVKALHPSARLLRWRVPAGGPGWPVGVCCNCGWGGNPYVVHAHRLPCIARTRFTIMIFALVVTRSLRVDSRIQLLSWERGWILRTL
jgi:hypothetical protein